MWMPAYPLWSLTLVAIDVLVICGLAAYGGKPELLARSGHLAGAGRPLPRPSMLEWVPRRDVALPASP